MAFVFTTLLCAAIYLMLTQNLAVNNLVTSLVIGVIAAALSKPKGGVSLARAPGALVAIVIYVLRLIVDIIKSGITVAGYILDPKLPIKPGIVGIKSHSNETVTAISAHGITITPGEQVLEIGDDGTMYTHCLNAPGSAEGGDAAQAIRKRLLDQAFG
jgi:multicomponent Na+:H+ antiporter subunit E